MERLRKTVAEKAQPTIVVTKTYTVIPELVFTDEQLNDPQPMSLTMREFYDMLVDNGADVQEDEHTEGQ